MKQILFVFAAAALAASAFAAVPKGWTDDFEAAQKRAAKEAKPMLVLFTGSDWCIWCKRLEGEVFSQEAFSKAIPKEMVAVFLDFPSDESLVTPARRMKNEWLGRIYGIRGYPTVLLMDAKGEVFAKTGYRPGGAEPYVEHLRQLVAEKMPKSAKAEAAKPGAKAGAK